MGLLGVCIGLNESAGCILSVTGYAEMLSEWYGQYEPLAFGSRFMKSW